MSHNSGNTVFFNAPLPSELRIALKQIAAIEQTSMAALIQRAVEAKVAEYQGRLHAPASVAGD
jgi:hypothetical protein